MHSCRPLLFVLSAAIACAASVDPVTLLSSVRSKVRENAGSMPRYVCRQRIERKDFAYLVAPWVVSCS